MLTFPDFENKQLLFILSENLAQSDVESKIKFRNENILFLKDKKIKNQLSCHKIFSIFIIGNFSLTTELLRQCKLFGISLFLLRSNFNLYLSINSVADGNYLLRSKQYTLREDDALDISKLIVGNKIDNQFSLLKSRNLNVSIKSNNLKKLLIKAKSAAFIRGLEGNVSKYFFNAYFEKLKWKSRKPRVKPDIPNFLLDMGYTFLFNFVDALLCLFGFDTYKGIYHKLFFQRKSLVCDIVEPFRSIIDREVLKMHTLKIVNKEDFKFYNESISLKSYKYNKKYATYFLNIIMKNKRDIYKYVHSFYRYILDDKKNSFPYFRISR